MRAVEMSIWQREDTHDFILNSDRGTQYTSGDYQRLLKNNQLVSSISTVGRCGDNAACEGFFGVMKRGRVNHRLYRTRDKA